MAKDKIDKWQVTHSEYLHRYPWLTVRRDSVLLPNGSQIPNYFVLEFPHWVNTIAITKHHKFIMISQYRHGLEQVGYELCAGVCDETDPSPLYTAQRELKEETGYGNGHWQQLMVLSPNPANHANLTYCFLATDVEKIAEPHLDSTEDLRVHLMTLKQVRQLLDNDQIMQALMAAPLWKYMALHCPS